MNEYLSVFQKIGGKWCGAQKRRDPKTTTGRGIDDDEDDDDSMNEKW